MIEQVIVYRTMGKDFDSEEKALAYRTDKVGECLDGVLASTFIPFKDRLKLVDFIVEHRAELIKLLDF